MSQAHARDSCVAPRSSRIARIRAPILRASAGLPRFVGTNANVVVKLSNASEPPLASGSGILITPGIVLTANHVINGIATKTINPPTIILSHPDGTDIARLASLKNPKIHKASIDPNDPADIAQDVGLVYVDPSSMT